MIISGNYNEYISCSTRFDKKYNLVAITHHIKFDNSYFKITII